jgi:hypothetical protein
LIDRLKSTDLKMEIMIQTKSFSKSSRIFKHQKLESFRLKESEKHVLCGKFLKHFLRYHENREEFCESFARAEFSNGLL